MGEPESDRHGLGALRPGDPHRIGEFRLLGRLGTGGMGTVFLGRDPDGRAAAVKVINEDLAGDAQAVARFRREAELGSRVRAHCVASVLGYSVERSPVWLASEFVSGPSLRRRVAQAGPLSPSQAHAVALGAAEALCAIHEVGIVHRDLTYTNILLAADRPVVIDFGIARTEESTRLTPGWPVGTTNWISPERWEGHSGGAPADIFAWAVTVLYAATGRLPYAADDPMRVRYLILNDSPELDALHQPLAGAVAAALDVRPEHRPTALDLCARLSGAADTGTTAAATRQVTQLLQERWHLSDPAQHVPLPATPPEPPTSRAP